MIPLTLLPLSDSRATGFCIYGAPGLRKTLSLWSAPPPILVFDFEGGTSSLLPWIRRARNWNDREWTVYPDAVRQAAHARVTAANRKSYHTTNPSPIIDVVHYEPTSADSWNQFTIDVANVARDQYNTIAVDSVKEYSETAKIFARGKGNENKLMTEVAFSWVGAQERSRMVLARLRDLRNSGVYIVLLSQQDIVKDYVFSPMNKDHKNDEPVAVSGTVNAPGQLANAVTHIVDVLLHVRMMNAAPCWIAKPEPLPGGIAYWDAKDRYGALEPYSLPSFHSAICAINGKDLGSAIYTHAYAMVEAQNAQIFGSNAPALDTAVADNTPQQPGDAPAASAD